MRSNVVGSRALECCKAKAEKFVDTYGTDF